MLENSKLVTGVALNLYFYLKNVNNVVYVFLYVQMTQYQ